MARKFKSTQPNAMNVPAQPARVTHNNNGPNWPAIILVGFFCITATGPLLWLALIYLMGVAGSRNPDREAALFILFGLVGVLALILFSWLGGRFVVSVINPIIDNVNQHKIELARLEIELEQTRLLQAGQPAPNHFRLTDKEQRLRANLLHVMIRAYSIVKSDDQITGARPWSRAQVLESHPDNMKLPYQQAPKVRDWLQQHEVIFGAPGQDQVNLDKFPNRAVFEAFLNEQFTRGINVVQAPGAAPASPLTRNARDYPSH